MCLLAENLRRIIAGFYKDISPVHFQLVLYDELDELELE